MDAAAPGSFVRLMLEEKGQAVYLTGTEAAQGTRRVLFLFRDMRHGEFSKPDPDGRLDLKSIAGIRLGCNTPADSFAFSASGFELVRLAR